MPKGLPMALRIKMDTIKKAKIKLHITSEIHERSNGTVAERPDGDPSIKGKKGNTDGLGEVVDDSRHDKHGTGGSDNNSGHTTKEGKKASRPAGRKDALDSSDTILHVGRVHGTKGQSGRNHRDKHEKGDGDGLLVEVGHFRDPVGTDRAFDVGHETLAPGLRLVCSTVKVEIPK